jgi:hypothetical protein
MQTVNILATSKRGRSRIGKQLVTAIVEQDHHDRLFLVIPEGSPCPPQCRWVLKANDPDFAIVAAD